MSAAELVTQLAAVGTPPELLAAVAEQLFKAEVELAALETIRRNARERKAKSRDVTGQDVTSQEVTTKGSLEVSPGNPLPKPSKSSPYIPPKIRSDFPAPDRVSEEQWAAFRKQRKKALNARSYTLLVNKLKELAEAGHDPGAMIDLAIERGWETVFEPRDFTNGKGGKPTYISDSGYEYRGDPRTVLREAERRADWGTYWKVKGEAERATR